MTTPPPSRQSPPIPEDRAVTDESVGAQMRHLRRARGLSLRVTAERMGLSPGHLSQIERGVSSASVRVLALAADALSVGVADFFAAGEKDDVRLVTRVFERDLVKFGSHGGVKELLTVHGERRGLDLFLIRLGPGDGSGEDAYTHSGIEAGVVLSGGFELDVDKRTYVLGEGDACCFASTRPHRFQNAGQREAVVLWVNYRERDDKKAATADQPTSPDDANSKGDKLP